MKIMQLRIINYCLKLYLMKALTIIYTLTFLILAWIFTSCNTDKLKVDVSNIEVNLNLKRLDQDLFKIDTSAMWSEIEQLSNRYGNFWDLYTHRIIGLGGAEKYEFANLLQEFITDLTISEAYNSSNELYNNFEPYLSKLNTAFKHYKYYYPDSVLPDIYTYIGGFNQSVVSDENILGIGLDKYLGENSPFYPMLQIPAYARKILTKDYIVVDCMQAWAIMQFEFNNDIKNLVNSMIYQGKLVYFSKAMMPDTPDSLLIKYSAKQIEWCKNSEHDMWIYLVENKLLFSTEYKEQVHFIKPAPFTVAFSNISPGRVGIWIGWQIVKKYMDNNPEITVQELMQENDYQKILNMSKYNP